MKTTRKKTIILIISSIPMFAASCNKESEEPADIIPTVANLSGTYNKIGSTQNGVNTFGQTPVCGRDDLITFMNYSSPDTVGTFIWKDAGLSCGSSVTAAYSRWSLTDLKITFWGISGTITSFNGSKLVITIPQGIVLTYRKQ